MKHTRRKQTNSVNSLPIIVTKTPITHVGVADGVGRVISGVCDFVCLWVRLSTL